MSPLLCHQLFLAVATLGAGTQGAGNPSMALGGGFLTLVLGLLQPGWQSFLWCVESQAGFCISANEAVEMQPVSFTNLDLPERNLFLLDRDLSSGLDMAWVCNMDFLPHKKFLCSHPFGCGICSRSPCKCWGRFLASCASAIHPSLVQIWVSPMAFIPHLFIRKIEIMEAPNPLYPRGQILVQSHRARRQIVFPWER